MKVTPVGPMYTHTNFCTSVCMHAGTVARYMKGSCMLAPISQATDIRSEALKKWTPPNMARTNQIQIVVGNGLKAHQTNPEGLE